MEPTIMYDTHGNSFWVTTTPMEPEVHLDPATDPLALDIKPKPELITIKQEPESTQELNVEPERDPLDISTLKNETKLETSSREVVANHSVSDCDDDSPTPDSYQLHTENSHPNSSVNTNRDISSPNPSDEFNTEYNDDVDDFTQDSVQPPDIPVAAKYGLKECYVSVNRYLISNPTVPVVQNYSLLQSIISQSLSVHDTAAVKYKLKECFVSVSRCLSSNHTARSSSQSTANDSPSTSRSVQNSLNLPKVTNKNIHFHKKFKCEVCSKIFPGRAKLTQHKRIHSRTPLTCRYKNCNKTFTSNDNLEFHRQSHKEEHKCNKCSKTYHSNYSLKDHQVSVHSKRIPICGICKKVCGSKASLVQHLEIHSRDGSKNFSCNDCHKSFVSKSVLNTHLKTHAMEFKCNKCEKQFAHKHLLETHLIISHDGEREFKCEDCGKLFATRTYLIEHKQSHKPPSFTCSLCSKVLQTKKILMNHLALIHSGKRLPCTLCSKSFTQSRYLRDHLKTHDLPTPEPIQLQCDNCDFVCQDAASFRTHNTLVHGGEKKHKCSSCKMMFISVKQLEAHKKRHIAFPFRCTFCRVKYPSKVRLEKHVKKNHSIVEYSCDVCSKSFSCEQYLKTHKLRHTKPYHCDLCDQKFGEKQGLDLHLAKIHKTQEYSCDKCPRTFPTIWYLREHYKMHNKIFKCNKCNESFARQKSLTLHEKHHTFVKEFKCNECFRSYSEVQSLNSHKPSHQRTQENYSCGDCNQTYQGMYGKMSLKRHIIAKHLIL